MKKITAMLLCLAMLFAFAGCGSKDTGSGSTGNNAKKGVSEDILPRLDIKSEVTVPDDFKIGISACTTKTPPMITTSFRL